MVGYPLLLMLLGLWIYTFVDCLNSPEDEVRNLPKPVWLLIILLFGALVIGPLAWLATGRPRPGLPGYAAPPIQPADWIAPDDNPEFLRSLSERIRPGEEDLKAWEADLRRREEELRRREREAGQGPADTDDPPLV